MEARRPRPFLLSPEESSSIGPRSIHRFATWVLLDNVKSMRRFIYQLTLNKNVSKLKPPLHIRGGYDKWNHVLHALFIYYCVLDENERQLEIYKAKKSLSPLHRQRYNKNIDNLHRNRIFIDGRETIINVNEVVIHPYQLSCTNNTTNDEIDRIDGVPCKCCNFLLTEKVLKSKQYQKKREENKNVNCLQCLVGVEQGLKQVNKNNLHNQLFQQQVINRPLPFKDKDLSFHTLNMESYLIGVFGEYISSLLLPLVGMNMKTSIKCITVPQYTPADMYDRRSKELKGAQCKLNGLHTHPNVISDSDHFEAVVVLLDKDRGDPDNQNFLVCFNDRDKDMEETLQKYRYYDEMNIKNGEEDDRSSPSGGVTQLENVRNCTKATTTFNSSTATGAYMTACYPGAKKAVELGGTMGYRSMPGALWNENRQKSFMETHPFYRSLLMKDVKTLIKAMACLGACGVESREGSECMNRLKSLLHNNLHKISEKDGMESILLEYIIGGFEEKRNYSAVACHTDGHMEILSVIDRLGHNTGNAYLYFPLDNFVYEFDVNNSMAVSNFSKTVHVADPSRGGSTASGDGGGGNTSRVRYRRKNT